MRGADGALDKATLAIAQVELPQTEEVIVVALLLQLVPGMAQVVVPDAQRARVVQAEIFHVVHVHVGLGSDDFQHFVNRRQRATGEDVALDKIDGVLRLFIALVTNGDGLQQHQPIGFEQVGALLEVGGQEAMAHGFDHLDGHQFVVLAAQVAVILQQQGDLPFQPLLLDTLFGVGELLA